MKKILSKLVLVLIFISAMILGSCEEPIPDCEKYGYGDVVVVNSTGIEIKVDVTEGDANYNNERWVNNGGSITYSKINAGSITIWASPDGANWSYDDHYLDPCEELTYTWYLNKKKSSSYGLYLEIHQNGKLVKSISDFKQITKK